MLETVLKRFKNRLWRIVLVSAIINILIMVPTFYMLQIYDRVMVSRNEWTLLFTSILTILLFSIMSLLEVVRSRWLIRDGERLDADLGLRIFNAAFSRSLALTSVAERTALRPFADLLQVRQFFTGPGLMALLDLPWTITFVFVMFLLHPVIGALGVTFVLTQLFMTALGHWRMRQPSETAAREHLRSLQYLYSKLQSSELIITLGMGKSLLQKWLEKHQGDIASTDLLQRTQNQTQALSKFIRYAQQSLTLGAASFLVIRGELTPGAMIASNVLMSRALAPIDTLAGSWRGLWSAKDGLNRLKALWSGHEETSQTRLDSDGAALPAPSSGQLAVANVTCTTPQRPKPICQGISFQISPGSTTVLVGPSGSGKSTIARAVLGIWPYTVGEVLLDSQPLKVFRPEDLGPFLGYLPQDIELFNGSVAENIARFGAVDPNKVVEAARLVGLHEMILRLPLGYDTLLGESGYSLSAGQTQRVGLARAVYGNPKLVVLDEPNSNLDEAGEQALAQAILNLKRKNCSVLLVTQRPAIVAVADHMIWLVEGQILAQGSPQSVLTSIRESALNRGSTGQPINVEAS